MPAPHATAGDEYRTELTKSGLSSSAVNGILYISGESYVAFEKVEERQNFGEAIMAVNKFHKDLQDFINTQSKDDQKAYAVYRLNH